MLQAPRALCAAVLVEDPVDIYNRYQMESLLFYHSPCFNTGGPHGLSETGSRHIMGKVTCRVPVP